MPAPAPSIRNVPVAVPPPSTPLQPDYSGATHVTTVSGEPAEIHVAESNPFHPFRSTASVPSMEITEREIAQRLIAQQIPLQTAKFQQIAMPAPVPTITTTAAFPQVSPIIVVGGGRRRKHGGGGGAGYGGYAGYGGFAAGGGHQ